MSIKSALFAFSFACATLVWTGTSSAQNISFQAGGTNSINPSGSVAFFTGTPLNFPLIVTEDDGVAQAARRARARAAYRERRAERDKRVRELRRQRAIARNQAALGYSPANLRSSVTATHQNLYQTYQQQHRQLYGFSGF